jgi:hypothetical protein
MAVVVQRQLSPDLCFVLHTRHPGERRPTPCRAPMPARPPAVGRMTTLLLAAPCLSRSTRLAYTFVCATPSLRQ